MQHPLMLESLRVELVLVQKQELDALTQINPLMSNQHPTVCLRIIYACIAVGHGITYLIHFTSQLQHPTVWC